MSLLHSRGKQENKGNKRTGQQREPGNRGKQGNKERRNYDFVYKLLMQNFPTEEIYHLSNTCREHVIDLTFGVKVTWTRMLDRKANGRSQ